MFQISVKSYASDALEDSMRLAQTKSLNSYTFSDCMESLNYIWSDIYNQMALVDDGYYGRTVRVTKKLTRLPPCVQNTLMVYSGQSPIDSRRVPFRNAGTGDMTAGRTFKISGFDLLCPSAEWDTVWMYYVPACPQLFFTHHNRDPKLYTEHDVVKKSNYALLKLIGFDKEGNEIDPALETEEKITSAIRWVLRNRANGYEEEIYIDKSGWDIVYVSCDFPYIFITYRHPVTGEHYSGFFTKDFEFVEYNPFAFSGRNSNVKYVECHWNDKTGYGVVIQDYNDLDELGEPRIKELGWTPDTLLDYPSPIMYRYLVARLADRFASLNESNVLGVQKELVEAKFAFNAFLNKNKAAWHRINNVNLPTVSDWL